MNKTAAIPRRPTITRSNWFEDFFHGVATDLWRKCIRPEQTRAEADFLEKTLGKKTRLLDVPCGNGRHSLELARRGCQVTGVDISEEFIAEAIAQAKALRVRAEFIPGDVRRLSLRSEFDGAFCMGNSFGYFEFPDMIAFVRGVARALKPGGRFVIETGAVAESLLPALHERQWYQVDEILFAIENRYLAEISCLETEATFVRDGKREVRKWWHWVYTVGEIRRLLEQVGLVTRNVFGSHDGRPFKLGDPLSLMVAEKRARRGPSARKKP
jgi:SAM-dependent methyltransferase